MRIYERLRVFVSSSMDELAEERAAVKVALAEQKVDAWLFEEDAGARPQSIHETFVEELAAADLYIGLYWKGLGEYTRAEYEQARKLGKDCLIYEKRAGIEGERAPDLQGFLDRLGKVETGHTVQWFETPEELGAMVATDVARWQADIVRQKRKPKIAAAPSPAEASDRRFHLSLIEKVRRSWIEGVLEQSIHSEAMLDLDKEIRPDAIENPWQGVLELPDQTARELPSGLAALDLFEEVGRSLLFLGAPGAGKTVALLSLARDLIRRAERDPSEPLPVVFNLSTWSGEPLVDWLTEELSGKYQIPRRFARRWLEECRLLPLLDGLDEVRADRRAACVEAINAFVEEVGVPGLVVCSRLQDYTDLPVRLKLGGAVCLQPLDRQRLATYFENAGDELAGLRQALDQDEALRSLADTPLMLDVMSLAYQGVSSDELTDERAASPEERRHRLFVTYVERMLARRQRDERYSEQQTTSWLRWLAGRMIDNSQSILLIENLQPSWLTHRLQLWFYAIASRLAAGMVLGLVTVAALALARVKDAPPVPWSWVLWGAAVMAGLLGGLEGLRLGQAGRSTASKALARLGRLGLASGLGLIWLGLVVWIAVLWFVWIVQLPDPRLHLFFTPLGAALLFSFAVTRYRARRGPEDDIATVENPRWSWRRFGRYLIVGGLLPGLMIYAVTTIQHDPGARLWDLTQGELLAALEGHTGNFNHIRGRFSPDGERLATASDDGTARLWSGRDGELLKVLEGHQKKVYGVRFSPDNRRLITRSDDSTVRLWDGRNGEPIAVLEPFRSFAAISSDSARILLGSGYEFTLWDARNGSRVAILSSPEQQPEKARFSPDGRRIVTLDHRENQARLWNAADGELIAPLEGHSRVVDRARFSGHSRRLVTVSRDHKARLWQSEDGALVATLEGHTGNLKVAVFSPQDDRLVTLADDGTARLWDGHDGRLLAVLEGPKGFAKSAVFSPDGTRLLTWFVVVTEASASHPERSTAVLARLWNGEDGTPIATLEGHPEPLESAVFSPDGAVLLTTSKDHIVRVWDGRSGTYLREYLSGQGIRPWRERFLTLVPEAAQWRSRRDGAVLSSLAIDEPFAALRRPGAVPVGGDWLSPDESRLLVTGRPSDYRRLAGLWLAFALAFAVVRSIDRGPREDKAAANEGIRLSIKNTLILGPLGGLVGVLILSMGIFRFDLAMLTDSSAWPGLAAIFLCFAVLTGLWFGGLDVIRHYILRAILAVSGQAPWRYADFLDHAAERILLRRVGGGYIFIHRLLLEHFAADPLTPAPASAEQSSAPPSAPTS